MVRAAAFIIALLAAAATLLPPTEGGRIINPGTNYQVNEDDIITYLGLGQPCDPAVQNNNNMKQGICRATLVCNPKTRLCDCEDIGPYLYTEQNGKCKNIVGSACYSTTDCVANAFCKQERCVCPAGRECARVKRPAKKVELN